MLKVTQTDKMADLRFEDAFHIAQAVWALLPDDKQIEARAALVHLALERRGQATSMDDPLERSLATVASSQRQIEIDPSLAAVLSQVFAAMAGILPHPAPGAERVFRHENVDPLPKGYRAVALLGPLFFLAPSE